MYGESKKLRERRIFTLKRGIPILAKVTCTKFVHKTLPAEKHQNCAELYRRLVIFYYFLLHNIRAHPKNPV